MHVRQISVGSAWWELFKLGQRFPVHPLCCICEPQPKMGNWEARIEFQRLPGLFNRLIESPRKIEFVRQAKVEQRGNRIEIEGAFSLCQGFVEPSASGKVICILMMGQGICWI